MPSAAVASAASAGSGSSSKKKKSEDATKKPAASKSDSSSGQSKIGSFFAPSGQKSISSFFAPAKEKVLPNDGESLKKKDEVSCESEKQQIESTPPKPEKEKASEKTADTSQNQGDDDCVMVLSDSEGKDDAQMKHTPPTARKIEVSARAAAKGEKGDVKSSDSAIPAQDKGKANSKAKKEQDKGKEKASDAIASPAASGTDKQDKPAGAKKKEAKKDDGGAKQGTLDFGKCAMKDWKMIWKKKERPQHPAGKTIEISDKHIMVLQFVQTFRKSLSLPALSIQELKDGLESEHVLSSLHVQMLRTIVRDGETPDEERLLDENTWPEVLRQHLQDVHGVMQEAIWKRLEKHEYSELSAEERLRTLEVLVDDCLASKTVRKVVDGSLDQLEDMRRQQMLDEIQEKCKKVETSDHNVGELDVFVEEVGTTEDGEGMTERQRSLHKQREEEARVQRIAEEKRLREEKRLAEEESRRKEQMARTKREETRAAQLMMHGSIVRVPQLAVQNYNYWVMDCIEAGERRLLCEQHGHEQAERNTWSMHSSAKDYVELLEYWNPKHPENDAKVQKKLRDFLPPAMNPPQPAAKENQEEGESMEVDGEEKEKEGEEQQKEEAVGEESAKETEEEKKQEEERKQEERKEEAAAALVAAREAVLTRAREVVLCLDECTPDDMFNDFQVYSETRGTWRTSAEEAQDISGLTSSVLAFEGYLKRQKMQEGWDEVRPKWLLDVGQAGTVACLSYLVKQLRVYIGKQKVKPGKLAAIFQGPMRMTRTRARLEQGLPEQRKRLAEESSVDEEESSGEEEVESAGEEWVEEKEEKEEKRETRGGGRASLRPVKVLKTAQRTSARPLRSSSRLAVTGARSLKEESEQGSDSDESTGKSKGRRSERVTRRRQRDEEEDDESDGSGPSTRRRSSRLTGR